MRMSKKIENKGYESPDCREKDLQLNSGLLQSATAPISDWVEGDDEMF